MGKFAQCETEKPRAESGGEIEFLNFMYQNFKQKWHKSAMETETIKNEASLKSQRVGLNFKTFAFFAFILSIGLIISCNDDKNEPNVDFWDSSVDVYVVGSLRGDAGIWKNGVLTTLTGVGTTSIAAKSVYVVEDDVYVAGSNEHIGPVILWKNGLPTTLLTANATVSSVFVAGNDVYVTGNRYYSEHYTTPILWKNGVAANLATKGSASFVFVAGNDVYVVGDDDGNLGGFAVLWKNGVPTNLQGESGIARSVFVTRNDVYIAGTAEGDNGKNQAALWKNGILSILPGEMGDANSVYVVGNDVYVAGRANDEEGYYRAALWKNGILFLLPFAQAETQKFSVANSVYVVGNDVYVAGYILGGEGRVVLWKNDKPIILGEGGRANSVYVVSR